MIKKIFSILIAVFLIAFSFLILNFRRVEAARTTWTESCNAPLSGGCESISCGPDEAGDCTDATCTNPAQWCPNRANASSVNDCAVSATPSCSCKGIRIPIDGFEWFYFCSKSGDCTKTGLCTYTCNPGFEDCNLNATDGCECPAVCVRDTPETNVIPPLKSSGPGGTLTYTLEVTNKDDPACGNSDFDLSFLFLCPPGWTCTFADNFLTISPGATKSTTVSITSSPTATAGNYIASVKVTNSIDPTYFTFDFINYTVVIGDCCPHTSLPPICPTTVKVGENFQCTQTYTHDKGSQGGVNFNWLSDMADISAVNGCPPAELIEDCLDINGVGCPCGNLDCYKVVECEHIDSDTTVTLTLKAKKNGNLNVYHRAWDWSYDAVCPWPEVDRDPVSGTCSTNCDQFPKIDVIVCDKYTTPITVTAAVCGACDGNCPAGCTGVDDPDCPGACLDCTCATDTDCSNTCAAGNGCCSGCLPPDPDCAVPCICTSWTNDTCGAAGCASDLMHQIRTCNPVGCDIVSQCVSDISCAIHFTNPLACGSIEECIERITDFIFWVAVALAPLTIIIAAFYFLTSGGDPEKIRTAKKIILYTCIGLVIIFLARGIISIIKQVIGG